MGDETFYTDFLDDHRAWMVNLIGYFSEKQKHNEEEEKWKQLVIVDYKSLEAAKNHLEQIDILKNKFATKILC